MLLPLPISIMFRYLPEAAVLLFRTESQDWKYLLLAAVVEEVLTMPVVAAEVE